MKTVFTKICKETFLITTLCGIYIYNISLACSVDSIVADNWLRPGFALENAAFWSGKMDGITDCAIGCVRRKLCTSFNYDMATNLCDLNYFHKGQVSLRPVRRSRVYSSISDWPPKIDPSCSSRPCTENQVCLPPIFPQAPLTQCSYICIDQTIHRSRCTGNSRCAVIGATCTTGSCLCPDGMDYDVRTKQCTMCPADPSTMYPNAVIDPGTGGERNFSCMSKYVKTVSKIECRLDNKTGARSWYPDTDICTDVYGSNCATNKECMAIGADCLNGTCQCDPDMVYDTTLKKCTTCTEDPSTLYAIATFESDTGEERNFTCAPKYVKAVTQIQCRLNSSTGVKSWYPPTDICKDLHGSNCTVDEECVDIGADCQNGTCQCRASMEYDALEKNCSTTCTDDPSTLYANATFESGTGEERNFTCAPKHVKAVTRIECRLNSSTGVRSWYPPTDICIDLHGSNCTVDTDCVDIGADCQNGTCQCRAYMVYDALEKNCSTTCTDDPSTLYANATFESDTGEERNFTCVPKYVKAVTQIECRLDESTGTKSWYPPTVICLDLFGSNCTGDAECTDIGAVCQENTCRCKASMVYDDTEKTCRCKASMVYDDTEKTCRCNASMVYDDTEKTCRCKASMVYDDTEKTCRCNASMVYDDTEKTCRNRTACPADPSTIYPNAVIDPGTGVERHFSCMSKYVKTVSKIECRLDNKTGARSWYPDTDICTDLFGSNCTGDAECTDIGAVCQGSTCQCNASMVYDDTEKTCRCKASMVYDDTEKTCRNRFHLEAGNSRGNGVNMGRLKYYFENEWCYVSHHDWRWKATKAVCRDIDPSFVHGGSFHKSDVYGEGTTGKTVKFKELDCTTDEMSLLNCTYKGQEKTDNHNKDLGITCFTEDVSDHIRLNSSYMDTNPFQRLEVLYNGTWGTVCEDGFGEKEENMACKSIDPLKPLQEDKCYDSCAGGPDGPYILNNIKCNDEEDHLFFCENGGWGNHNCPNQEIGLICKSN